MKGERVPCLAAGLGCSRGCPAQDVVDAVRAALARVGRELDEIDALYAPEFKRSEPGLLTAAENLGKALHWLPLTALQAQNAGALSSSPRVLDSFGVPSISETAALAGACRAVPSAIGARLLGARQAAGGAMCALALVELELGS